MFDQNQSPSPTPAQASTWRRLLRPRVLLPAAIASLAIGVFVFSGTTKGLKVDAAELDPLMKAGDTKAVSDLLDRGLDPVFALVRAARVGSAPMVSFLLKKGADPNGFLDDGFKSTALMAGASGNHPQIVAALAAAGADLDQRDALGDPALNWASYMGHVEYSRELIERGASRDIRSVHGNSFEIALRQGWDPLIELLGTAARDKLRPEDVTMLNAVAAGDTSRVAASLTAGVSPGLRTGAGIPLLSLASKAGDVALVKMLIAAGAGVDETDPIGFTPLFYAARAGQVETLRMVAGAGANLDHAATPGGMGMTALHMASAKGQIEAIRALVELGAHVDAVNSRGESALVWSLTEGHPQAGVVLLKAGADPDLESQSGYSGRKAAREYEYKEVLAVMKPAGRG